MKLKQIRKKVKDIEKDLRKIDKEMDELNKQRLKRQKDFNRVLVEEVKHKQSSS